MERFNIQSGIHRAKYGAPAHKSAVRGISCDNLNQFVVTGGSDGYIKFFNFKDNDLTQPITKLKLTDGVCMFRAHRESSILAVVLEDFSVAILDCDIRNIVRQFTGHTATITDACFSPDSRWLLTASMDCTIKIWDIPSSYLIDHFRVEKACISLTMSPTGDFLATAHVNYLGLFLWANKSLYSHVSLRSIDPLSEAPLLDLPTYTQQANSEESLEDKLGILELGEEINADYQSPIQLDNSLITMSQVATSRWQNLLNIDLVKKRNRPKQPLKKPKQAPFFLPTVAGLELKFDVNTPVNENADESSKLLVPHDFQNLTIFGRTLDAAAVKGGDAELDKCVEHILRLGPSMIDFEIKSLHPDAGGSVRIMLQFMKMIERMFRSKVNFELAQTYLGVFLKSHGRSIVEYAPTRLYLANIEAAQTEGWKVLEEKLLYGIGVVSTLRKIAV